MTNEQQNEQVSHMDSPKPSEQQATAGSAPATSHTPGPWDDAPKYPHIPSVRIFAGTRYIATVGDHATSRDVIEANARLMAAAPELLAAVKLAETWLVNCMPVSNLEGPKPLPVIRAAIAKAEGRQ